jgi:hypothetical protein
MDANKIDPQLKRALDPSSGRSGPIQAVIVVGSPAGSKPLAPAESEQMLRGLVDRAAEETQSFPERLVLFPNVQSFSIEADPELLRRLLENDSIDAASLNSSVSKY